MRYIKVISTFLDYSAGARQDVGVSYFSQELKIDERRIIIRTISGGKDTEVHLLLEGPELLRFKSAPTLGQSPQISGRFFDAQYEESVSSAAVGGKNLVVVGTVSKLSAGSFLSTKTLTEAGQLVAVMQERMESMTEAEFQLATKPTA